MVLVVQGHIFGAIKDMELNLISVNSRMTYSSLSNCVVVVVFSSNLVVMAKAIANGFPFAAIVTRPEIAKTVGTYFNTYGGNPIGCAVASAVLDVIKEEKLQENAHRVGTHLLNRLAKLRDEMPDVIGDVRGKGLLIGMEMVVDRVNRYRNSNSNLHFFLIRILENLFHWKK